MLEGCVDRVVEACINKGVADISIKKGGGVAVCTSSCNLCAITLLSASTQCERNERDTVASTLRSESNIWAMILLGRVGSGLG